MARFKTVALLITTLAFAVSSADVSLEPDNQLDCTSRHGPWYADENDCTKFYMCTMGQARLQQCPDGEFFDIERKSCRPGSCNVESDETKQSRADVEATSDQSSKQSKAAAQCTEGSIQANSQDSTMFYVCVNGVMRAQRCPSGMNFNPTKGYCMTGGGYGTNCGDIPNGGFTAASYSNQYYVCTNGELMLQLCPQGQTFSPVLKYCTNTATSSTRPPSPTLPTTTLDCGAISQGQFVSDPLDESKYFVCILGKLRPQTCASGQVFNFNISMCVNVDPSGTVLPGSCGPFAPGTSIAICGNTTVDSSYYLFCTMGVFVMTQCPTNMVFNPTAKQCVGTSASVATSNVAIKPAASSSLGALSASNPMFASLLNGNSINAPTMGHKPSGSKFPSMFNTNVKESTGNVCAGKPRGTFVADRMNKQVYHVCPSTLPKFCPAHQQFAVALSALNPPCAPLPLPACPIGESRTLVPLYLSHAPQKLQGFSQYYVECSRGSKTIQKCSDGSILYNGECTQMFFARSRNSASEEVDETENSCSHHGEYQPVVGDCEKFTVCLNSILVQHSCPRGQYFNAIDGTCMTNDRQQCVTASQKVEMHSRFLNDHNGLAAKKAPRTVENFDCFGKHGVFQADPTDCRHFYACVNGWKVGQYCQQGEIYDDKTRSCTEDIENICSSYTFNIFLEALSTQDDSEPKEEKPDDKFEEVATIDVTCMGRDHGEFLANEKECTAYYVCSNGFAVPKQCPADHYFDAAKKICRPNDGSCASLQTPTESPELPIYLASSDNTTICTGKHGIIVPDQEDCTSFYLCIYGRAHHDHCYDGEFFDSLRRHCTTNDGQCAEINKDVIEQVEEEEKPIATTESAKQLNNICNGYFDGTHLPNQDNCNRFFVCIDGIPVPEQCAETEFFDSIHGYCRANKEGADSCSKKPSEEAVCYGKHGIHIEHPDECRKYYLCVNGQALVHDCNANEYFNTRMGSCILDVEGTCTGVKIETAPKENVAKDIAEDSDDDQKELSSVAEVDETAVQEVKIPEVQKSSIPKCIDSFSQYMFYPNVEDECRTFYECVNGEPKIHSCPIGFIFNAVLNICDVPDFVECSYSMDLLDTREPSCEGAASGVRYANYENGCQSFYLCAHGNAMQTTCGEGLLYNAIMGVCDWANNVHCPSGRAGTLPPI